jgi:tRNA dimethylallyltransferase
VAVVRGEMTVAEAEHAIVTETMRFAKRQRTWFRHQQPDAKWFSDADEAFAAVLRWLEEAPAEGPGGRGVCDMNVGGSRRPSVLPRRTPSDR